MLGSPTMEKTMPKRPTPERLMLERPTPERPTAEPPTLSEDARQLPETPMQYGPSCLVLMREQIMMGITREASVASGSTMHAGFIFRAFARWFSSIYLF